MAFVILLKPGFKWSDSSLVVILMRSTILLLFGIALCHLDDWTVSLAYDRRNKCTSKPHEGAHLSRMSQNIYMIFWQMQIKQGLVNGQELFGMHSVY